MDYEDMTEEQIGWYVEFEISMDERIPAVVFAKTYDGMYDHGTLTWDKKRECYWVGDIMFNLEDVRHTRVCGDYKRIYIKLEEWELYEGEEEEVV